MYPRIRAVLAGKRISQVDLALSIHMDPTLLSRILNGRRPATPEIRCRIAEALDADEAWLFKTDLKIPPRVSRAD